MSDYDFARLLHKSIEALTDGGHLDPLRDGADGRPIPVRVDVAIDLVALAQKLREYLIVVIPRK